MVEESMGNQQLSARLARLGEQLKGIPLTQLIVALTIIALLAVAATGSATIRFYTQLGISATEVGIDYQLVLMRSGFGAIAIAFIIGGLAFLTSNVARMLVSGTAPQHLLGYNRGSPTGRPGAWAPLIIAKRIVLALPAAMLFLAWLAFGIGLAGLGQELTILILALTILLSLLASMVEVESTILKIDEENPHVRTLLPWLGWASTGMLMIGLLFVSFRNLGDIDPSPTVLSLLIWFTVGAPFYMPLVFGTALSRGLRHGSRLRSYIIAKAHWEGRWLSITVAFVAYVGLLASAHFIAQSDVERIKSGETVVPTYLNQMIHGGAPCVMVSWIMPEQDDEALLRMGHYLGDSPAFSLLCTLPSGNQRTAGIVRVPLGSAMMLPSEECSN